MEGIFVGLPVCSAGAARFNSWQLIAAAKIGTVRAGARSVHVYAYTQARAYICACVHICTCGTCGACGANGQKKIPLDYRLGGFRCGVM